MQLLEHLRPELELRLDIAPGDDETWEEVIDGAAEGVEELREVLQAPDVWVRASILHHTGQHSLENSRSGPAKCGL